MYVNTPSADVYTGPDIVITVPADALAPNGARPSVDLVLAA